MKCLDTTLLIDIVEHPEEAGSVVERFEQEHETLATTTFNAYEALLGVHSVKTVPKGIEFVGVLTVEV